MVSFYIYYMYMNERTRDIVIIIYSSCFSFTIYFLFLRHKFTFFRVVSYEQCDREYFTISNAGVSYYRPGEEVEFTPLENFAKEYHRYVRLIKVNSSY